MTDLHQEIQGESSDLGVSEEWSLLSASLGYLLDIKDLQVDIPHFSRVENDMCLKEVPQPLGYLLCFRSNERVNRPGTHFQGRGIENKLLKVA